MDKDYMFELIQNGKIKIVTYGFIEHPKNFSIQKTIHDFDVLYTVKGLYSITINNQQYTARQNDVFVVPPGSELSLGANEDSQQFFFHFVVEDKNGRLLGADFADYHYPQSSDSKLIMLYEQYIQENIEKKQELASYVVLLLKLILIEMLNHYTNNHLAALSGNEEILPDSVSCVLNYIHHNLNRELTSARLAQIAGYNAVYFNCYFKKYTGVTPFIYINNYRMEYAHRLVCETGKSLSEIAGLIGYSDQFSFSKKFKKYFGTSPSKMRDTDI